MTPPAEPFVPRYPPLDLEPFARRIAERDEYVCGVGNSATRAAVEADTEIMRELLREVRNLRLANEGLKDVIAAMRPKGAP
jgi:hypothetical protein